MKIVILSILVVPLFLFQISSTPLPHSLSQAEIDEIKSHCAAVCNNASAEIMFNEEGACSCIIVANVNAQQMDTIQENARFLNLHLQPAHNSRYSNSRLRRFIPTNSGNQISPHLEAVDEKEPIVGQAAPILPPRGLLPNRPLITQDAAMRNLADIRKRLRELSVHSTRNAAAHAQAIRHNLRQLSNRAIIAPTPEHRLQRARINQERMARERQRIQRLNTHRIHNSKLLPPRRPGVLGASADNDDDVTTTAPLPETPKKNNRKSNKNDDEELVVPNDTHHSIITQPEEFFED